MKIILSKYLQHPYQQCICYSGLPFRFQCLCVSVTSATLQATYQLKHAQRTTLAC